MRLILWRDSPFLAEQGLLFWLSANITAPNQKGSLDGLDAKRKRLRSAIQEIVQNP
jgi:hypothetical protein